MLMFERERERTRLDHYTFIALRGVAEMMIADSISIVKLITRDA